MWSLASTIPPRENPSAEAENTNSWWVRGLRRPECNAATRLILYFDEGSNAPGQGHFNRRLWSPTSHERNICIQFDCFAAVRRETLLGWRQTCAVSDCVQICLALSQKPISFIHFWLDFAPSVNKVDGTKFWSWSWRTVAFFLSH